MDLVPLLPAGRRTTSRDTAPRTTHSDPQGRNRRPAPVPYTAPLDKPVRPNTRRGLPQGNARKHRNGPPPATDQAGTLMLVLTRLETAPTWVQSVALGLAFGAFWVLSQRLLFAHDWGGTLASGVLASALYGAIVGPLTAKKRRVARTEAGLDALPVHQQRTALRAARRGPTPPDPEVRHAAVRLAAQRRDRIHAQRVLATTLVAAAATAASALAALASSPWWWAYTALFAGALLTQLTQPRRLHHRITLLQAQR